MAIVPNVTECQPRFILYTRLMGLCEGDEWKPYEYMAWINGMVARYHQANGRGDMYIRDHNDFTRWIGENIFSNS